MSDAWFEITDILDTEGGPIPNLPNGVEACIGQYYDGKYYCRIYASTSILDDLRVDDGFKEWTDAEIESALEDHPRMNLTDLERQFSI